MIRILSSVLAAVVLCIFSTPQTADAAPSLDWNGKEQIVYEVPSSPFGFNVLAESMGHGPSKEERNAKKALSGAAMLGIGIPVTILGVALMVPAFYLLGAAIAVDVAADGSEVEGAGSLLFGIPSIILFSLAIPALVSGINLIVGGAKALSKIEAHRMERREDRYAMKSQKRARWGMQVSVAGVPLNR